MTPPKKFSHGQDYPSNIKCGGGRVDITIIENNTPEKIIALDEGALKLESTLVATQWSWKLEHKQQNKKQK